MTQPVALGRRRSNPFVSEDALANSQCVAWREGKLERVPDPAQPVAPFVEYVHDTFRAQVLNPRFSCVGAKAAVHAGTYRLGVYGNMATAGATAGLARDLFTFIEDAREGGAGFATFVATFTGPIAPDELAFEAHLWAQLRALHALDLPHHPWDPSVSADPEDPTFAFSFGGSALFVVGLHPAASRWSRRFTWPTLVFNPHAQFDRLRAEGKFMRLRDVIRGRDEALQGSVNPMASDHGATSEARQYAGRAVEEGWRCPFSHGKT